MSSTEAILRNTWGASQSLINSWGGGKLLLLCPLLTFFFFSCCQDVYFPFLWLYIQSDFKPVFSRFLL